MRSGSRESGASAVEMAMALPLVVLVLVGSGALLWMGGARAALARGAAAGARYAAIPESIEDCTGAPSCDTGEYPDIDDLADRVAEDTPLFDVDVVLRCVYRGDAPPDDLSLWETSEDPAAAPGAPCEADAEPNQKVAVAVRHRVPNVFRPLTGVFSLEDRLMILVREARTE